MRAAPCLAAGDGASCLLALLCVATQRDRATCDVCGFAMASVLDLSAEPLPRLPREETEKGGSLDCRVCGTPLTGGRRRYCSDRCTRRVAHRAGVAVLEKPLKVPRRLSPPRIWRLGTR